MAQDEQGSGRSRKRERLTTLLLALFPVLAAVGFLAPGWVRVLAWAEPADPGMRERVVDRVGPWGRRPLVPRDFSAGFTPELLDLDQLFLTADFDMAPSGKHFAGVSAFERSYGDSIALDDVGVRAFDVAFRDLLMPGEAPPEQLLTFDPYMTNLGVCDTLYASNCIREDDVHSSIVVGLPIPEPGTAALLALGLLGLAAKPRRS